MSSELKQSNKLENEYNQFLSKANKIHLELLSFIQNEINEKKKKEKLFFSFSSPQNKNEIENNKFSKHKESISNEQKSGNTLVNSDDDEDELEESSNMSCDEENIIDVWRIELLLCNILNVNTYEYVIFIKNNNIR